MGCAGTHPPWFCRAFGKLPAKEREKLIVDNKLCPFCLLHDKDKPCGARQRPASVACTIHGCKGRHAQKLHKVLKDIFRGEGRVHVLQEDDGWEESDGAWELGETEGMIVGAVRQEDEYSWSDACSAWTALDEEAEAGVHQVQAGESETSGADQGDGQLEAEGLLIEGEEREYVLELLLRETPVETCASDCPTRAKPTAPKSKRKRQLEKKLHKRAKVVKEGTAKVSEKSEGSVIPGRGKEQAAHETLCGPETRGGKAAEGDCGKGDQSKAARPTLGRECSV
jgi:hypothetical protein